MPEHVDCNDVAGHAFLAPPERQKTSQTTHMKGIIFILGKGIGIPSPLAIAHSMGVTLPLGETHPNIGGAINSLIPLKPGENDACEAIVLPPLAGL